MFKVCLNKMMNDKENRKLNSETSQIICSRTMNYQQVLNVDITNMYKYIKSEKKNLQNHKPFLV